MHRWYSSLTLPRLPRATAILSLLPHCATHLISHPTENFRCWPMCRTYRVLHNRWSVWTELIPFFPVRLAEQGQCLPSVSVVRLTSTLTPLPYWLNIDWGCSPSTNKRLLTPSERANHSLQPSERMFLFLVYFMVPSQFLYTIIFHRRHDWVANASTSYTGGTELKSRPRNQLSWLRISVNFLSTFREMPEEFLK
jgi:hypothetical protein